MAKWDPSKAASWSQPWSPNFTIGKYIKVEINFDRDLGHTVKINGLKCNKGYPDVPSARAAAVRIAKNMVDQMAKDLNEFDPEKIF